MIFANLPGARNGGTRIDGFKEPLQVRISGERILKPLEHARGPIQPSPRGHVGNGVSISDDEVSALQMIVEDLIMTLGLTAIAIDGVIKAFWRRVLKVDCLA